MASIPSVPPTDPSKVLGTRQIFGKRSVMDVIDVKIQSGLNDRQKIPMKAVIAQTRKAVAHVTGRPKC